MKKILKWVARIFGIIVLLIIIASVVIILIVDKEMVEDQMINALNRHVTIKDIDVGIISAVSGIEVNGVNISNFKTKKQLELLKGKPVNPKDIFIGLKSFKFKVKFLPLLSKQFVLKQLVLYEPQINIARGKNGGFNFDDLLQPEKLTPEEKAELEEEKKEASKEAAEEAKEKAEEEKNKKPEKEKPFTADDLPVEINIGKIGIEKGVITVVDKGTGQTIQLYNLTLLVHSIKIDPKALDKKNSVGLDVDLGIKTVGKVTSGSVQSFDIGLNIDGTVKPFDLKTRQVDPEISVKAGSSYGTANGLQIFDKLKSNESLSKYSGKLGFLKKALKWKDAYVKIWYKGGLAKLTEGRIKTDDFSSKFDGTYNTNSTAMKVNLDMILADKHKKSIRDGLKSNVKKAIKGDVAKVVKPDAITDAAMKPLLNKDGKVYMKYLVTGKSSNPKTKLIHPKLQSIGSMVKKAAGKMGSVVKDMAKEAAKKAAEEAKRKAAAKAKRKAKKKIRKLF